MAPEEQARRGDEAQRLLENPLLVEAFDVIERQCIEEIKKCPVRDAEGLAKLHLMLLLNQRLRAQIEAVVSTGKIARASLLKRAAGRGRLTD